MTRSRLCIFICLLASLHLRVISAQENYVSYELRRDNNWDALFTEDMNGDGNNDLIYSHYDPVIGRELWIHHQQNDGTFAASPQRIEIKTEIIGAGFADLRKDPGKEIILLASTGVFSLSTAINGYAGNLEHLIDWNLIAAIPDRDNLHFLTTIEDFNNDGYVDLILPGEGGYGVFLGNRDGGFDLNATIATLDQNLLLAQRNNREADFEANIGINSRDGIKVELSVERPTPFQDFVEIWKAKSSSSRALLRDDNWMPSLLLAELTGDNLKDLIYLNVNDEGEGQLNIHYQNDSGFKETPDWQASTDTRGTIALADINNDGIQDFYRLIGDGNEWDARFHINRNGSFKLSEPSQIMRFSGYDARLNFVTLKPDSELILNVNSYSIPVVDAIRNAAIKRTQLIYPLNPNDSEALYDRRPTTRLEETFSATNFRGLSEQMSLRYDVDGDGNKDALYVTENGTLAAKRIDSSLQISDEPFWEYVSPRTVFEFEVLPLNEDGKPDLILRHGVSTTILVSSP